MGEAVVWTEREKCLLESRKQKGHDVWGKLIGLDGLVHLFVPQTLSGAAFLFKDQT